MTTRIAFQSASRAGAMQLITDYCASVSLESQRYLARPKQLKPPTFYVESISEVLTPFTLADRQRSTRVTIRAIWGRFDDGIAVVARDKFVDGFLDWVADNYHAFGPNTDVNAVAVADSPEFNFGDGELFFSTAIALEGFAAT